MANHCQYCNADFVSNMAKCPHCGAQLSDKDETKNGTLTEIEIKILESEINQLSYAEMGCAFFGGMTGSYAYHTSSTMWLVYAIILFVIAIWSHYDGKKKQQQLIEDARIREGKIET